MNDPTRPKLIERTVYEPCGPQEEFMVPLLGERIEGLLDKYATPDSAKARALDVGCGGQPFRKRLESSGYQYTGMDVQQNIDGAVDVIGAIDEPLPNQLLALGPFQFLLCTEVLEHVADWGTAFHNLATVLAPGGRLLITCPQFYQLHEEPYDFWRPTLHALNHFSNRVGLRTLTQEAAGDTWDVLGTLLANSSPSAASDHPLDRGVAKLAVWGHRLLFDLLRTRRLQRAVQLSGPLYLSNIVVLERP